MTGCHIAARFRSLGLALLGLATGACAFLDARPALAQYETPVISCGRAQAAVRANGAAVIHSTRSIYDRYVTDQRFCVLGETTQAAWIVTTDNPQCFVGYRCVARDYNRLRR